MDEFSIPTVPTDSYRLLCNAIADEAIRLENGYDYYTAFAPWLSDWRASESQMLVQKANQIESFPGLKALHSAYKRQMPLSVISDVVQHREWQAYQNLFMPTIEAIRGFNSSEPFGYGKDFDLGLSIAPPESNFAEYSQNNISQHYRDKQVNLASIAYEFLQESLHHLERLSRKYEWKVHLRPMFTMQSAMHRQIHQSMGKAGLSQPELYMTPGQMKVWDRLKSNNVRFPQSPYDPRREYWDWYYRGSFMYLSDASYSDIEIHFGPWNFPPTFLARPTDVIPYYFAVPRGTWHTGHAIHFLQYWTPGAGRPEIATFESPVTHYVLAMADLMPVICGCLTLITASIRTGQGQHKPYWTQASFNIAMLRIFSHACASAIKAVRSL